MIKHALWKDFSTIERFDAGEFMFFPFVLPGVFLVSFLFFLILYITSFQDTRHLNDFIPCKVWNIRVSFLPLETMGNLALKGEKGSLFFHIRNRSTNCLPIPVAHSPRPTKAFADTDFPEPPRILRCYTIEKEARTYSTHPLCYSFYPASSSSSQTKSLEASRWDHCRIHSPRREFPLANPWPRLCCP